jgi:hypothetical protein
MNKRVHIFQRASFESKDTLAPCKQSGFRGSLGWVGPNLMAVFTQIFWEHVAGELAVKAYSIMDIRCTPTS